MSTFTEYYVGYEVEGYYLTTTSFKTLDEAQAAIDIISAVNPNINYHITSLIHNYVPHSQTNSYSNSNITFVNTSVESPFTGMTYESFGKGFLLRPTPSHPDTGTKYFHNGWWMPKHSAWFFKTSQEQTLCEGGAIYISDNVQASTTDTPTTIEDTPNDTPFVGMTISTHGKGYLLTPTDNHPDIGTKYYHNGWWMPSLGGWFFKNQYFNDLIQGGAIDDMPDLIDSEDEEYEASDNSSTDTEVDDEFEDVGPFTDMTIDTYGRGYLLVPPTDHPNYGEKYFHNGWWLTSQNAWFFKTKHYDYLIDNGATLQTNPDTDSESNQTDNATEGSYSGMNVTSYGRGYLLTPTENHPDYGCKYYGDGWWMPKHSAWFFKSNQYQTLINNGAIAV